MNLLIKTVFAATVALASTAALAQQAPNGSAGAVPGVGPGGSGDQSGTTTKPMVKGAVSGVPGSQSGSASDPTNTTGQPAGDKPAQ